MTIRYPNGKRFETSPKSRKLPKKTNEITYSNRGMTLEEDINTTNEWYLETGKAVIHKKPTPVQIVKVDYPKRSAAVIKEAYFKQASTTDYNGVYKGRYIDFEAKETKNKTSFPLKNFHDHQVKHMKEVLTQQGICFILLRFSTTDEVYLLDATHLIKFYEQMADSRKSIRKSDVERYGHLIKIGYHPRIDYLPIVDEVYFS
ncbi:Holliday junction resolvase RecU [Alkalihalophilus pseudofirmus]|uniref:Holliday junction resolvase RecU n=1 Tax=Alkalihalophilus pseudofirmus TaxID=79885 RepID=A0AAJ2NKE3_ALKPS|nr:Holliday junction resolvase RecU [Alkalihalophilus pseudofirmus]MDV2884377.1 Holliday junction resolvase RecU [Alkalihalophilus pseudofirmus]WEG19057.1 Holliday junction resolvase RecU [Alkalihalophilus pseudofirmus]